MIKEENFNSVFNKIGIEAKELKQILQRSNKEELDFKFGCSIYEFFEVLHDLFTKFVNSTHYTLESVIIYQIIDGVFFSNLNFKNTENGEELILDARTSDAVAMAVRFDAPIYTTEQVLNEAGILLEIDNNNELPEPETASESETSDLRKLSTEELQILLDDAVREEDYDSAMEIQEELKRRNKKID